MRLCCILTFFLAAVGNAGGQSTFSKKNVEFDQHQRVLEKNNIKLDNASLLKFFRERIPVPAQQAELREMIETLGARSFRKRTLAAYQIRKAGPKALPYLQAALSSADPEVAKRTQQLLDPLLAKEQKEAAVLTSAVIILAVRRPKGTVQLLFDFLPFVQDAYVIDQVQKSLFVLTANGEPPAEAIAARKSSHAIRRGIAGAVLARSPKSRPLAIKLLRDPSPIVRYHVAHSLILAEDPRGVATLIGTLDKLERDLAWQSENVLFQLAGARAPATTMATSSARKVRQAWEHWWQANAKHARKLLAKLAKAPHRFGFTLIGQMTPGNNINSEVFELGLNKRVRWKFAGLRYPVDAQIVRHNRILIAESSKGRVTERDFQGKIRWTFAIERPIACQRLASGNTFIAARRLLVEIDRTGKEVFTYRPEMGITAARKTQTGEVVMITTARACVRLNAAGKAVKSFAAGPVYSLGGNIDALPSGRVLVPEYSRNRVVEYTRDGKIAWQANIRFPTTATRLAGGNTLVVCAIDQRVVEVDPHGRVVWQFATGNRPWCARRR